ncbi:MAG: NADH-quinone oxidoreductase subunit [Rhodospirillaceae bacterium]|jgi:NADH-quinone oxidoreductase subunit G|nr:NADH-quinone oxidoreductase subunit [Rhodospirillaceae bacterium]
MPSILVDGNTYTVAAGHNLLHACLSLGFDLPYFCWHPALGSVGACRQCAVKQFRDANDAKGRLVMACMTPASDGARVSIHDPEAVAFRASVIEWLMANHPHDCPVCEEGGECHLQDMTLMTGHSYRRYRFRKRTFRNQDLGPFIGHEMNRCIACYRCVRYYRDYAGGDDLHVFASHNHVYFGRYADGTLENEFSGNLVEVCPTGVFTDKTLSARYTRKWDLQGAPSVCPHCSLGCNTQPNERYGELRRIVNRYNYEVNGYFLCDRGRFGYGFVNAPERVRHPLLRVGPATPTSIPKEEAIVAAASLIREHAASAGVIGIGSPRASLEANFALRTLVGPDRFHIGISEMDRRLLSLVIDVLVRGPVKSASIRDAEQADAVVILGEDVTNTAPRLALALRQSVRHAGFELADRLHIPRWQDASVRDAARDVRSPLVVLSDDATRLDDVATATYRAAPDDIARLGFAIARHFDAAVPEAPDLAGSLRDLAGDIARQLQSAKRPLIVSGMSSRSEAVLQAAANLAWALTTAGGEPRVSFVVPEYNSLGLGLMGGESLGAALDAASSGKAHTMVVLENDLYRRANRDRVDAGVSSTRNLIVIDQVLHETAARADLVLSAGSFAESDGTFVNNEGRAQRAFRVFAPEAPIEPSWKWIADVLAALEAVREDPPVSWRSLDDVMSACAEAVPALAGIIGAAPSAKFRIAGMKIAREPPRYSGRTAMFADRTVFEPPPPPDPDSPLNFSMEGYYGEMPGALYPYFWAPGWNSEQAVAKFQDEVGGPLRGGDPGVRLLEPRSGAPPAYFGNVPAAFRAREGEWLLMPQHHIFGSDELSALAPVIRQRTPAPYLALNPDDAAKLGADAGALIDISVGNASLRLPLQLHPALPRGTAGWPTWVKSEIFLDAPAWARIVVVR